MTKPSELIEKLHDIATHEQVRRVLELLKQFDPYELKTKYPQPMFFGDCWEESFECLISENETRK